jgi:hypothetical protein
MMYWADKALEEEMKEKGCLVVHYEKKDFSVSYNRLMEKTAIWFEKKIVRYDSIKLTRKLHSAYKKHTFKWKRFVKDIYYNTAVNVSSRLETKIISKEGNMIITEKPYMFYREMMLEMQIECMFTITPFLPEVNLMGRALSSLGKPVLAFVQSFDNVTKRGWQFFLFDHYLVWNEDNKKEMLELYPSLRPEQVTITGAPQFDFHFNASYILPRDQWLQITGIPPGKRVILYAGGVDVHFPTEPQYAVYIKSAIENNVLPADTVLLVRSHPQCSIERWKEFIGPSDVVYYYQPKNGDVKANYCNVSQDEIKMLVSTLYHTDVHLNICSSMSVDGSIFNKPLISPYFDDINKAAEPALRAIYEQKHYKEILNSGVVQLAKNKEALIDIIKQNIDQPVTSPLAAKQCIASVLTFMDGKSTQRVLDFALQFFIDNKQNFTQDAG